MMSNWLPFLYLASWPIIAHTLGPDALLNHALITMLFIATTDIARQFMLNLVSVFSINQENKPFFQMYITNRFE